MTKTLVIAKREFSVFFASPTGYITLSIFLVGGALFLWVFPNEYSVLSSGYASLDGMFAIAPYLFLFLCPAITMRSLAEERQQGTIELLMVRPISKRQIVLGKLLGAWFVVVVALVLTLVWFVAIWLLASPQGNVDSGAFWGSMIGLLFLSLVYISIGVFTSSFSSNQIFAFITGATISFVMFRGFDFFSMLFAKGSVSRFVSSIGINYHYRSVSRGVIDSRDLLYFVVATLLFTYLTVFLIKRKK